MASRTEKIRALNDQFRRRPAFGSVVITPGILAMGTTFMIEALRAVVAFQQFDENNDPYGEHDFGSIVIDGVTIFFKIDTYDTDLRHFSPDPSDAAVTRRILTIMLAEEY